jgi:hypothetical protein
LNLAHSASDPHPALPAHTSELVRSLLQLIREEGCTDAQFDAAAAQLFAHQYSFNSPYRRFCQRRGITPRKVTGWRDIPPMPISAFKEVTLSCQPAETCARVFMTSGTTRADARGCHHHPTIEVWDESMRRNFAHRFMRGRQRIRMAILFPPETELRNSSLARYLAQAVDAFGTADSRWFVGAEGMETAPLRNALTAAERSGEPHALLGASYSFVHLMDALRGEGKSYALPEGSLILDTGGYKRGSRALPLEMFYGTLSDTLGVPRSACINMYGMTELSTQFYDDGNAVLPSVKSGPHWIRTRTVDPLTGLDVPPGEPGILVHCDLANFNAATTILTEDVGISVEGGFLLLGRAEGAQAKGCSLAVEEFLRAAAE